MELTRTSAPKRISPWTLGAVLALILLVIVAASLFSGHIRLSIPDIARTVWAALAGGDTALSEAQTMILWSVRMPRIAAALAAGAALGLSGAMFQGLLLNPLADPYTLGVSSGAALGAALVIVAGMFLPGMPVLAAPWALTVGAFVVAGLTLVAVVLLARDREGRLSPTSLILAGVIMSAILSAALSFIKYLAGDQVGSIVFWLLGSLQARTWTDAAVVSAFFLPAFAAALRHAVDLNIMTTGVRAAETLGVNAARVRTLLLAAAALAAAAAVSVAGVIGFVGLVVPHLARLACGPDHRALLPLSALGGAALLVAADSVVRVLLPGEIPVGVLTALLAGPVFLVLFRKRMTGGDHA